MYIQYISSVYTCIFCKYYVDMKVLLSLNLSNDWNATRIRLAVLKLGKMLSESQKEIIQHQMKTYGVDETKKLLMELNELLAGFEYVTPEKKQNRTKQNKTTNEGDN